MATDIQTDANLRANVYTLDHRLKHLSKEAKTSLAGKNQHAATTNLRPIKAACKPVAVGGNRVVE